jgi:hypothetical protein
MSDKINSRNTLILCRLSSPQYMVLTFGTNRVGSCLLQVDVIIQVQVINVPKL